MLTQGGTVTCKTTKEAQDIANTSGGASTPSTAGGGGVPPVVVKIVPIVVIILAYICGTFIYCCYKQSRHEKGKCQGGFCVTFCECGPDCCEEKPDSFWNKEEARLGRPVRPPGAGDMRPAMF